MKKFLLGSAALAAMIAGPAMAADMYVKAPPPPPPPAYYDWSGAYLGFNIGSTWYDVDRTFLAGPTPGFPGNPNFTTSDSDGIYGFHAGAQWQWGAWVLGAEAALSGCFRECRSVSGTLPVNAGFLPNTFGEHKMTNLFTAGGRLGYAWDRWMIFATGGWASADLKAAYCNSLTGTCDGPAQAFASGASRNSGWYAGGGFDWMVHRGALVDVILGVEYQHYDVGGENAFCFNPGCNPVNLNDYNLSAKGDLVRARLTFKTQGYGFLWGGPAPAY
ncbi:MAG TPA: outer membrane beta-barrel protein [Acetobacteraceae bacterium]|jgi:outer membrane immunogenic protein